MLARGRGVHVYKSASFKKTTETFRTRSKSNAKANASRIISLLRSKLDLFDTDSILWRHGAAQVIDWECVARQAEGVYGASG